MNTLEDIRNLTINSCGISDCDATWRWDTGKAGFRDYDLWMVIRGKGQMRTDQGGTEVSQGSCLILFPNTHYVAEHDKEHLLIMNVHFSLGTDLLLSLEENMPPFLHQYMFDLGFMQNIISRVICLYNAAKKDEAEIFFKAALVEYFQQNSLNILHKKDKKRLLILKLCNKINMMPEGNYKLSTIAQGYGYSSDYFGRLFAKYVGINFSEYIANARINKAKYLLSSTDSTIEQIAELLGYNDVPYFSKQFQHIVGTPPSMYRKNMRNS